MIQKSVCQFFRLLPPSRRGCAVRHGRLSFLIGYPALSAIAFFFTFAPGGRPAPKFTSVLPARASQSAKHPPLQSSGIGFPFSRLVNRTLRPGPQYLVKETLATSGDRCFQPEASPHYRVFSPGAPVRHEAYSSTSLKAIASSLEWTGTCTNKDTPPPG